MAAELLVNGKEVKLSNDFVPLRKNSLYNYITITRMTTFIKTKFKISDDQTNIDKYRLAANITE